MILEINIDNLSLSKPERERERERESLSVDVNNDSIIITNESFAVYTFYYIIKDGSLYLADNPSEFKRHITLELDTEIAKENIFLVNQLTDSCTFKNVECLNPGQRLSVTRNGITKAVFFDPIESLTTLASASKAHEYELASDQILNAVKNSLQESSKPKLLALSGGIDSRLIGAAMLHLGERPLCYTMGSHDESDVIIAKSLTESSGLKWHHFYSSDSNDFDSDRNHLKLLVKHFAEYSLNSTSLAASLRRLPILEFVDSHQLIDGGFGEIFRSRYLYKLRYLNRIKSVESKDLLNQLITGNSTKDLQFVTNTGKRVQELWSKTSSVSFAERLDIFSIATRLKHFGGPEHRRLNSFMHSAMPFASDELLKKMFEIPASIRSSKRFILYCLQKWHPEWVDIPFTKFGQPQKLNRPDIIAKVRRSLVPKSADSISYRDIIISLFDDEFAHLWSRHGDFGIFKSLNNNTPKKLSEVDFPMEWLTLALAID